MKNFLLWTCLALLIGCSKQTGKQTSNQEFGEPQEIASGGLTKSAVSSRQVDGSLLGEEQYERLGEERVRRFLSEPGPPEYVAIRNETWTVGEAGLVDYRNNPKYTEMMNNDLEYRYEHHPFFIFEGKVFQLIREAEKQAPEARFRIGYLVILRYATHPKEGISLWNTMWNHIGPDDHLVAKAVELMSEASGENLETLGAFSPALADFAEKWMGEHPIVGLDWRE